MARTSRSLVLLAALLGLAALGLWFGFSGVADTEREWYLDDGPEPVGPTGTTSGSHKPPVKLQELETGGAAEVERTILPTQQVRVVDESGQPVVGANLWATSLDVTGGTWYCESKSDGIARLGKRVADEWSAVCRGKRYGAWVGTIEDARARPIVLRRKDGSVSVTGGWTLGSRTLVRVEHSLQSLNNEPLPRWVRERSKRSLFVWANIGGKAAVLPGCGSPLGMTSVRVMEGYVITSGNGRSLSHREMAVDGGHITIQVKARPGFRLVPRKPGASNRSDIVTAGMPGTLEYRLLRGEREVGRGKLSNVFEGCEIWIPIDLDKPRPDRIEAVWREVFGPPSKNTWSVPTHGYHVDLGNVSI